MEGDGAVRVGGGVGAAASFPVVVAGGALGVEPLVVGGALADRGEPGVLGLAGGFEHRVGLFGGGDQGGRVERLLVEDVGEVDAAGVLHAAELDEVGEAVAGEPVQGARPPLSPGVQQGAPAPAEHGEPAGEDAGDADGEPGGEDQAVQGVGGVADDDAVLGEALDAVGVGGVDQGDVLPVERRVVRVGKGGALAGVAVPGLELLGGGGVGDLAGDPGPQLVHLGGVGRLVGGFEGGGVALAAEAGEEFLQQGGGGGPAVGDQVRLRLFAGDDPQEVLPALVGPALAVGAHLLGGGAAVAAYVHGGGGALEDVDVSGVLGEFRDGLDAGGAGADDADALSGEPGHAAVRGAAGVAVVPARGVEGVAGELLDAREGGELGLREGAGRRDHVTGAEGVVPVGGDQPLLCGVVPGE